MIFAAVLLEMMFHDCFSQKITGALLPLSKLSPCCFQHILNKYSVSPCRVIYHNMRDRTDQLSVLDYRRAAHECVNIGPTYFYTDYFLNSPLSTKKPHQVGAISLYDRKSKFVYTYYNGTNIILVLFF